MPRTARSALLLAALLLLPLAPRPAAAEGPVDLDTLARIRDEGFHHSQVMETLRHLTDDLGPRVTGSPQAKAASEWARQQLADWGLANAHLEPFDFGRGWSWSGASLALLRPGRERIQLVAIPRGYTPGTNGPVRGALFPVKISTEKDLEQYRGKLAGKVLLLDEAHDFTKDDTDPRRYTEETLDELVQYKIPGASSGDDRTKRALERLRLWRARNKFFTSEKVVAVLETSTAPWGIVRANGSSGFRVGENAGPPDLIVAAEGYNRLLREAQAAEKDGKKAQDAAQGGGAQVELDVQARFYDNDDHKSYNTIAEIPGTDESGEVVMLGGHIDSWHAGTGATDDGAGTVVAMEAMRILKAIGVKPRRTIRVALWTGEEQGMFGSFAYVAQHFGSRPVPEDPDEKLLFPDRWTTKPFRAKPEHAKLAAYFNLDNGSGKIRGIYTEENAAVVPVFEAWMRPLRDLGVDTVTMRHTGSTDHVGFDDAGLPGFQFIQDELDYRARTLHTNMDTLDHVEREDLMQASVVMASFVYQAAMRPEKLPRKPMPQ